MANNTHSAKDVFANASYGNEHSNAADGGVFAPHSNLELGAMGGYQPDLENYIAQVGYNPQDIQVFVLESPEAYKFLDDTTSGDTGAKRHAVMRSLLEVQAVSVTGLVRETSIESTERQVGKAGQMMHDDQRAIEAQPDVTFEFDDRANGTIWQLIDDEIRLFHRDPTTQRPGIMNEVEATDALIEAATLPSFRTFTLLFVEPDITGTRVVHAWKAINFTFSSTGSIESQKDITASTDQVRLSIPTKATYDQSKATKLLAQELLDTINYVGAGRNNKPAIVEGVSASVAGGNTDNAGLVNQIKTLVDTKAQ